jgi:hypothetical protein
MFLMTTPPCLVPCPVHALSNHAENSRAGINRSTRFRPVRLLLLTETGRDAMMTPIA